MKTWKPIEKIIYDLKIWDDGVHGEHTLPGQDRMIIAETLLRVPESVREKVMEEVIFISIGGAYGQVWHKILSELSEDLLFKKSMDVVRVEIELEIILLNFSEMNRNNLDEEEMRITVAHEIAHFILEHHKNGGGSPSLWREKEKEADDLIVEWGFKRAYQSYERFSKRRTRA